jgi:hypothetical protein
LDAGVSKIIAPGVQIHGFTSSWAHIAKTPAIIPTGWIYQNGTWGAGVTKIGFDSFDFNTSSLVHDAEDGVVSTSVTIASPMEQGLFLQKSPAVSAIQSLFTQRKHVKMIF